MRLSSTSFLALILLLPLTIKLVGSALGPPRNYLSENDSKLPRYGASASPTSKPMYTTSPIFAMSYGFSEHSISERVDFLASAGYDGIGGFVFNERTLEDFRQTMQHPVVKSDALQVYGVYMPLNNERPEALQIVRGVLELGHPQNAPIWLSLSNANATEEEIIDFTQSVCTLAAEFRTDVILYPHDRHYILDVEDSISLIEKVDRPNLYTSLHLPHELRAGNADRLSEIIAAAIPYTKLVTVSGAKPPDNYNTGSQDWSDVVQALSYSQFDVQAFVQQLKEAGYTGPIGYNNWKIPGDTEEHHRDTLTLLKSWLAN